MDRRLLFPAVAATAWAQQTSPAAVEAEEALRDRVQQFYQLQAEKKYRQAEAFVADDTKDLYYAGKKPDIKGFSVEKVELLDNNTKAKVIVKAKVLVLMMGAGAQIFDMPTPTEWKLENGEWCWYISEEAKHSSPFGHLKTEQGGALDVKGQVPGGLEHPDLSALRGAATIDRTAVDLSDAGTQTVTITNGLPGPLDLRLDPHAQMIKGLKVDVSKTHLDAGEKATVAFRRVGGAKISDVVEIAAFPVNKLFDIAVTAK